MLPSDETEQVRHDIAARLEPLRQEDPGFRYELSEPSWDIPANDLPVESPVVQSLLNASADLTGRPESARSFPGATDAPHLKTPAVVCGPGSLSQAHSINEFVEIEQCVRATRMYLRAVTDLIA